ncbi:lipopolysaccharide heptosyltransferase II [Ktedonosporobacter rubrisoli]|uniref:lipopolysaccharide heptosyltransferase II n=2 Tax=Ktedonosporobacter rubrisoli TaxID=2509675 RepID=A0A4P6K1I9_KTERU|nr:lipopolysaccharide heptosyltransferase II [Ktedonosporobacter rubrisoli]
MTTPLLEVIRSNYPEATITYVAGSWSKVIAEHQPAVDIVIDSQTVGISGRYSLSDYLKLAQRLRQRHFDLAFVLDRSPMLALLPWLAGIPRRVGPDSLGRGFALTDKVAVSTSPEQLEHQAEIYLNLARAIGLTVQHPHMHFQPTAEERQSALHASGLQIAVFPGGGSNPGMELTAKRWPLARYRALVDRLVKERQARVLLIGGPDDTALTQAILNELDVPEGTVIDLAGKLSIGQLAAQLEACSLFIGNDSSPMHLAAAVGIPVIAIFGPTSPQEYGPYPLDEAKHVAIWRHPTGRPCFFLGQMQACANCTCMASVSVDDVWEAVERLTSSAQSKEVAS